MILKTPDSRWPAWLWHKKVAPDLAPEHRRAGPQFEVYERQIEDRRSVVLAVPHVERRADAHLIALVPPGGGGVETGRYYTLEKGIGEHGNRTVLGEWTRGGTHRNHGTGPEPEPDAFAAAVAGLPGGPSDEMAEVF